MEPLIRFEGVAAPLAMVNVDTDIIIRIEKLGRCPRNELGQWAFEPLRYLENGMENPDFILNRSGWRNSKIIVAGANFGCGSSREHAVWALQGMGVRCVIAPSFGEIFRSNCFQNGVLPIQLASQEADWLMRELEKQCDAGKPVSLIIDLAELSLSWPCRREWLIAIDERQRIALMEGEDEIGLSLKMLSTIERWQKHARAEFPWIWNLP